MTTVPVKAIQFSLTYITLYKALRHVRRDAQLLEYVVCTARESLCGYYTRVCKEVFNVRMIVRKLNFSSKKEITCSEDVLVAISCDDRLIKTTEANGIFIAAADFWRLQPQRLGSRARAPPLALIGADLTFA